QFGEYLVQTFPLGLDSGLYPSVHLGVVDSTFCRLGAVLVYVRGRIIDQLSEQHASSCGEWPARPPQMQGRRVSVADGLLTSCLLIDRFQGDGNFDELTLFHTSRHAHLLEQTNGLLKSSYSPRMTHSATNGTQYEISLSTCTDRLGDPLRSSGHILVFPYTDTHPPCSCQS